MSETHETARKVETAVLVALSTGKQPSEKTEEYLDELAFLAETLGVRSLKKFHQRLQNPDPRFFIGKGKMEEIQSYIKAYSVDMVIFDDDLSPSQLRNLENEFNCKIYDRSLLILDIFLQRAQTAQARTQVELARYNYLLPRLTRMWTHLERQRGGTGTRGGSGEKEIETDRRVIRDQIIVLKEKLKKIEKQGATQRKARGRVVKVALVGYTNVGKSTIMSLVSKSDVFAENKLFATVDSTVRKVVLEGIPFLLSDTVGFIRKLPHTLIESFKSTLDEVREADVLLHVIDISHPSFEEQMATVNSTLAEIGAADKPMILVFNKMDLYRNTENEDNSQMDLEELKATYMNREDFKCVFISAINKKNIQEMKAVLMEEVSRKHYIIYPNYL